jgi:hypothetical protein
VASWLAWQYGFRNQIHDDKDGHAMPVDLTSGAYRLRDLTDTAAGGLYEGKVIVDKTYGHATYGCMICCGPEFALMEFDPLGLVVSGSGNQQVQTTNSCGGGQQTVSGDFPTWWTDNTAIATANRNQIHGVASGTTNHNAQSIPMYWGFRENASSCPQSQQRPNASTNVGQSMELVGATCNANPSFPYGGNWAHPASNCFLSEPFAVPNGGACVEVGTLPGGGPKNCYQTKVGSCVTTYCAVNARIADSACTRFIDQAGYTATKVGCP